MLLFNINYISKLKLNTHLQNLKNSSTPTRKKNPSDPDNTYFSIRRRFSISFATLIGTINILTMSSSEQSEVLNLANCALKNK